jgi:hypothetical protein
MEKASETGDPSKGNSSLSGHAAEEVEAMEDKEN